MIPIFIPRVGNSYIYQLTKPRVDNPPNVHAVTCESRCYYCAYIVFALSGSIYAKFTHWTEALKVGSARPTNFIFHILIKNSIMKDPTNF